MGCADLGVAHRHWGGSGASQQQHTAWLQRGTLARKPPPRATETIKEIPQRGYFFQKGHPTHIHGCVELMQLLAHNRTLSQMPFSCLFTAT